MSPIDLKPLLTDSSSEVLEAMCFVSVLGPLESDFAGEDAPAVRLEFRGPFNGEFGLRAPRLTARYMAANFLGEDDLSEGDLRILEVLGEFSNMICGAFLARMGGSGVFNLSHPEVFDGVAPSDPQTASCRFELDDGALEVWTRLEAA